MTRPWEKYKVGPTSSGALGSDSCRPLEQLYHVAHLKTAVRILEDGKIKQSLIYDKSKLNKDRILVCWLSPNFWANGSRYGNISFEFEFAPLVKHKNYYWVESINYTPDACRILITEKDYDGILERYDPTDGKGPWFFDKASNTHYWNGKYCLEFMFEQDMSLRHAIEIDFVKHHGRYCNLGFDDCKDRLDSDQKINARFISYILSNNTQLKKGLLTKENRYGIAPSNSLSDALENIVGLLYDRGKFKMIRGNLKEGDASAKTIVRSALYHRYLGDKDSFRQLAALFENIDEFTKVLKELVIEKFEIVQKNLRFLND
ncbi:hypothetical protein [Taibaiella chishuiensis]|uniref:Uncharacterized protein n=1 Tax=Taibaiella chishuiensis TaxID=1434707 RepID=A0A2P8D2Z4_9BACT|nr:hypothetical protein [Taibaiella chishuiensis]PSK91583.1 hypothetical protein B0I18_105168 [Taibaiella chishuiensis]